MLTLPDMCSDMGVGGRKKVIDTHRHITQTHNTDTHIDIDTHKHTQTHTDILTHAHTHTYTPPLHITVMETPYNSLLFPFLSSVSTDGPLCQL